MITLYDLWLPILLSAMSSFFLSSLIHILLRYHRNNFYPLKKEDAFCQAIKPLNIEPGEYMFPYADCKKDSDAKKHEQKMKSGPVGFITVLPNGTWSLGARLFQWFLYCFLISLFSAYIAIHALPIGTPVSKIFEITACCSFASYSIGLVQNSIWFFRRWITTVKYLVDGMIYGLATGAIFSWLWPL